MEKSALEETEKKLYGKGELPSPPQPKPPPPPPPPSPPPPKISRLPMSPEKQRKLVRIFAVVSIVGIIFAAFLFWRGFFGFSASRVDVKIAGPVETVAGEEVTWQVEVINRNRGALEAGVLTFVFPDASLDPETGTSVFEKKENIGRLEGGSSASFSFSSIVIGGDGFKREASASMRFRPEGSSLTLEKASAHIVSVSLFPVSLTLEGPQETITGEVVPVNLTLFNESTRTFGDLRVRIEYPTGFDFQSSQSPLIDNDRTWLIGEIVPSEEKLQEIFGSVWGSEGEGKIFRAFLEYDEPGGWKVYREVAHRVDLAVVPLNLDVDLVSPAGAQNGVDPNTLLTYEISWRNNFEVPLTGIVLTASLQGEMFNLSSLETTGTFNTARSEIRWSQAQIPEIGVLEPGEGGNASFRIRTKANLVSGGSNLVLTVQANISSETKPAGLTVEAVRASGRHEARVRGGVSLDAYALYNETRRGLSNTGPYPLQVGAPTTFTVHWGLAGLANSFRDVRVAAVLPSGIEWTDETSLPAGAGAIRYDPFTREVSWEINSLSAGASVEAVFKIRATPSPAQQGDTISVLSETTIRAEDTFSGNQFESVAGELDSTLPRDPAGSNNNGRVQ